jgi:hypothetical protein
MPVIFFQTKNNFFYSGWVGVGMVKKLGIRLNSAPFKVTFEVWLGFSLGFACVAQGQPIHFPRIQKKRSQKI